MNVRWLPWSELLAEAGILRSLDASLNQIEGPEARRIAQAVNMAVDFAWKFHPWECACWFMRDLTGHAEDPAGTPLLENGYSLLQTYAEDPLAAWDAGRDPRTFAFRTGSGRDRLYGDEATPFYLIRTAAPRFGGEDRSTSTAYKTGALIYDSATGECWRAVVGHTNTAVPATWEDWLLAAPMENGDLRRRNGVLYEKAGGAEDASEATEPGFGADWAVSWEDTVHTWTPMRLPHFLLPAVLAGARSWMDSPNTGAMQEAMTPALETEVSDFTITRRQRHQKGGSTVIL